MRMLQPMLLWLWRSHINPEKQTPNTGNETSGELVPSQQHFKPFLFCNKWRHLRHKQRAARAMSRCKQASAQSGRRGIKIRSKTYIITIQVQNSAAAVTPAKKLPLLNAPVSDPSVGDSLELQQQLVRTSGKTCKRVASLSALASHWH
jgi:hypothetical protein